MAGRVIHISEMEATSNFADVLARWRGGRDRSGTLPVAVVRPA